MYKLSAVFGDITKMQVEAIVNAANKTLRGGGGVDGAIHEAAGRELFDECCSLGGCNVGEAKITKAYNIKDVKHVIHTVGPQVYSKEVRQQEKNELRDCYWNSLEVAKEHNVKSIAFPCISTGIYSFPNELACQIATNTVNEWMEKNPVIEKVIFCCYMKHDYELYKERLGDHSAGDSEEVTETSDESTKQNE